MRKKTSKRYKKLTDTFKDKKLATLEETIMKAKQSCTAKFDESIDVSLNLNLIQKKEEVSLRTVVNLPHGNGKKVKVAVLCEENKINEAKSSGAEIFGTDTLVEEILAGKINFDKLIATPGMMSKMGKLGKILGPKGLMPNPKLGTVTQDIKSAVTNAKAGQVQYKNDKAGIVHAGIGKLNFNEEDLLENLKAFYSSISKSKPDAVKGSFIKKVSIASTMGFGLEINTTNLR